MAHTTVDQARQELRSYRETLRYLRRKREDIEAARARLEGGSSWMHIEPLLISRQPGESDTQYARRQRKARQAASMPRKAAAGNAFEDGMVKLVDLIREHERLYRENEKRRLRIEKRIDALAQPHKNVLYLRYVRGWSWARVAREAGYTLNHVNYYLHERAVEAYSKVKCF